MRAFVVFILSCASVFGGDTGLRVVTTALTNAETGAVHTRDVFMRDAQTNLVRDTLTEAGVMPMRIQKLYHNGVFIGNYEANKYMPGTLHIQAGIQYSVRLDFGHSNELRGVVIGTGAVIGTKDDILDMFTCTNGLLYPVETVSTQQFNKLLSDRSPTWSNTALEPTATAPSVSTNK